jgi:hypothetical protein
MRKISFAVLAGLVLALAPVVHAQQTPGDSSQAPGERGRGGALRAACAADMQKLCPDAQGREARRQCLTDNKSQLSPDCAAALAAAPPAPAR